jgi:hypothetical protein
MRKEKIREEFGILHRHTVDAFDVVPLTINFMPGHGANLAHADL